MLFNCLRVVIVLLVVGLRIEKVSENLAVVDLEPLNTAGWLSVYLVAGDNSLAIVDPGPRASLDRFLKLLPELNLSKFSTVYVVLTHIHIDHSGVVGDLAELIPNLKVVVHPRGVKHLVDPSRLWQASLDVLGELAKAFGEPKPLPPDRVVAVDTGTQIELGGVRLVAHYTPGHAPHHISYILEPVGILLAGDSIANYFNGRIYPVTVHPFDRDSFLKSLDLMLSLNPRQVAVSHYGIVRDEPEVFIQRTKDKLIAWIHYIESLLKEGVENIKQIYSHILAKDVELAYIKRLEDSMPAFHGSSYRVIAGLYNYLLRKD